MAILDPQPPINLKLVDDQGVTANYWQGYLLSLDRFVRDLDKRISNIEKILKIPAG